MRSRLYALAASVFVLTITVGLLRGGGAGGDREHQLASRLQCPVCQGVSVADSPSETSHAMRDRIRELIAEGYSDQEILDYFVERYGEWVLLDPPLGARTWALWLLPAVLAAGGLAGLLWRSRRRRRRPVELTPERRAAVERALQELDETEVAW